MDTNNYFKKQNKTGVSTEQFKRLGIHEVLVIDNLENRGGVYQIAMQSGIRVKTAKTPDGKLAIMRVA